MKKLVFTAIAIILTFGLTLQAQEEKQPRMKVTHFGLSFGFAGAGTANTNDDFVALSRVVNDPDLFIDPNDFERSQYNFGFGGNVSPKLYIGLTPFNRKKGEYNYERELRFSLGTGAGTRRMFNYYRFDDTRIDTLQSNSTNRTVFADSLVYDRYWYSETFYEFNFSAAFLFKTPYERRFHFSAGVGIEYAYAYRAFVNVENYNEESVIFYEPNDPPVFDEPKYGFYYYDDDRSNGTTTTNTTNMTGSTHFFRTYFPLGIHFRIARKEQSFFNKVYLWTEIAPGFELQNVLDDKVYVNPYFGVAMFGLSYRW